MTYDLRPENKKAEEFGFTCFGWMKVMKVIGSAIGYREDTTPITDIRDVGKYWYQPDENGHSPMNNDGYHVSGEEALEMEKLLRVHVDTLNKNLHDFDDFKIRDYYTQFADWLKTCGGFYIH